MVSSPLSVGCRRQRLCAERGWRYRQLAQAPVLAGDDGQHLVHLILLASASILQAGISSPPASVYT